jgi:RNA polymerase sigma-70 factor (ECF subfamily)
MGEVDDAKLLRRACNGNESAFSELFARYQRRIYQYAARMCGRAAADDVVQETFLAVLNTGRFDASKGTVASYLFGIARHHVIGRLEKRGVDLYEPAELGDVSIAAAHESPFDTLARQRTVATVREAVESLPPLYREVVVLCDLQEMDYAVVANVIECPIGTVRSRLHRARALLYAKLTSDVRECEVGRKHG